MSVSGVDASLPDPIYVISLKASWSVFFGKCGIMPHLGVFYSAFVVLCVALCHSVVKAVLRSVLKPRLRGNEQDVRTGGYDSPLENPREDTLFWHDAVSGLVVDRTAGVAFFPDLGDFEKRRTDLKFAADRE